MSQDYEEYYIPKHLDSPSKIIFWQVDEFMMFFAPIMLGLFMDKLLVSSIAGILIYMQWKKIKGLGKGNTPLFFIYWFLPKVCISFKRTPHSDQTLFI